jgi:hypothetical protein
MIYAYDFGPQQRRLVYAAPGTPCICVAVDPDLYDAYLAVATQHGQELAATMQRALRQALETLRTGEEPVVPYPGAAADASQTASGVVVAEAHEPVDGAAQGTGEALEHL